MHKRLKYKLFMHFFADLAIAIKSFYCYDKKGYIIGQLYIGEKI